MGKCHKIQRLMTNWTIVFTKSMTKCQTSSVIKKPLQITVERMASPGGEWPKASEKNEHGLTHN